MITFVAILTFLIFSVSASAQPSLTRLTINPSIVAGGQTATGKVTLTGVATEAAVTIGLESSNTAYVTVPSSVVVPVGASSATFTISTSKVTQQLTEGVTAINHKIELHTSFTLAVDVLKSVTTQPDFVAGGLPANVTVTLQAPAPPGGWPVTITTNNSLCQVPLCTVPAGQTSCTCCVVFQSCNEPCVVEITAEDSTGTKESTQLDVNALNFFNFDGPQGSPTTINGISTTDEIVGFCTPIAANYNFVFTPSFHFLEVNLGDPAGSLNAINSSNLGVGVANGTAVKEAEGVVTKIKISGATSSVAFGVNNSGVIVGQYTLASGVTPGFVDVGGVITTLLPKSNATVVNPQGVNNHNLVVGFYSINGVNQFPFTYNIATKAYTFPANPSTTRTAANGLVLTQFLGVNDAGIVCGYYQTNNGSQYGLLYNLNSSTYIYVDDPDAMPVDGVQITQLVGITADTVAGFYIDGGGQMHGFFAK